MASAFCDILIESDSSSSESEEVEPPIICTFNHSTVTSLAFRHHVTFSTANFKSMPNSRHLHKLFNRSKRRLIADNPYFLFFLFVVPLNYFSVICCLWHWLGLIAIILTRKFRLKLSNELFFVNVAEMNGLTDWTTPLSLIPLALMMKLD